MFRQYFPNRPSAMRAKTVRLRETTHGAHAFIASNYLHVSHNVLVCSVEKIQIKILMPPAMRRLIVKETTLSSENSKTSWFSFQFLRRMMKRSCLIWIIDTAVRYDISCLSLWTICTSMSAHAKGWAEEVTYLGSLGS